MEPGAGAVGRREVALSPDRALGDTVVLVVRDRAGRGGGRSGRRRGRRDGGTRETGGQGQGGDGCERGPDDRATCSHMLLLVAVVQVVLTVAQVVLRVVLTTGQGMVRVRVVQV